MPSIAQQDYIRIELFGCPHDEIRDFVGDAEKARLVECYKNGTLMDVILFCNKDIDGTPYLFPWEARVVSWTASLDDYPYNNLFVYVSEPEFGLIEISITLTD